MGSTRLSPILSAGETHASAAVRAVFSNLLEVIGFVERLMLNCESVVRRDSFSAIHLPLARQGNDIKKATRLDATISIKRKIVGVSARRHCYRQ